MTDNSMVNNNDSTTTQPVPGLALTCRPDGTITRIIRDDLGMAPEHVVGESIVRLVDAGSIKKTFNFIEELHAAGAAFQWEINVPDGDAIIVMQFAGAASDDELIIVGAKPGDNIMQLYEEMIRMHNEQVNSLRSSLKENVQLRHRHRHNGNSDSYYDEFMRLNNELVNLQREMTKKNVELERLVEEKNQLLGMAAHDLRNPLGIILSYSEYLLEEATNVLDDDDAEFIKVIRDSSEFMLELVNNLLDVATIEAGELQLHLEPLDLVFLMRRNLARNQVLASNKRIVIQLHADHGLPPVLADGPKIDQVINNLVGNAIKFSHPESVVEIEMRQVDGFVQVAVRDQGIGIPNEELGRLFQPFVRLNSRGTAGERSVGLGLAITRRIIDGHAGQIHIESTPGQGSTFFFTLPIAPADESVTAMAADPHLRRVLVADDDPINRKTVVQMLQNLGYQTETATDGVDVLRALSFKSYDLILMDVHMPHMDGLETARRVRRQWPEEQGPKIIGMTASLLPSDRQRCLDAGMDGFIGKPASLQELAVLLRRAMVGRRHSRRGHM